MLLDLVSRSKLALTILLALQPAGDEIKFFSLKDPEPPRGLAWFVLNAFYLVGVAIAVTLAIGIAFGGFRYWLLSKFPHNRFNGAPEDDPLTALKLSSSPEAED